MHDSVYNFKIYQGNDDIYVLNIQTVDNNGNKRNTNISNYSFILTVKKELLDEVLFTLTTDSGYIKVGVLDSSKSFVETQSDPNCLQIHFPHVFTETLTQPEYVYDLFGVKAQNIRELFLNGKLLVTRGVTYGGSNS